MPPAFSTHMPASLWNPASRSADSSARADIGLAGLTTPQDQGVQLDMIGGAYRIRPGLTAALSFAQASVSDILRTETDPQSIGGEIPYGTTSPLGRPRDDAAASSFGTWSAGLAARYRWATVDQDHGGAFALDGGVIVDKIARHSAARAPRRRFCSALGRRERGDASSRQSTPRCCVAIRPSCAPATPRRRLEARGREDYVFTSVGLPLVQRSAAGFDWSTAFGDQDRRLATRHRSALCGVHRRDRPRGRRGRPRRELSVPRDADDSMTTTRESPANRREPARPHAGRRAGAARRHFSSAPASRRTAPRRSSRRLWLNPAPSFDADDRAAEGAPRVAGRARSSCRGSRSRRDRSRRTARRSSSSACTTARRSRRVAIPEGDRVTLCISSQAGCALQCAFCATGAMGFSAQPLDVRDRRSGARDAPARSADRRHEHRVHGHGRAADELEGGRSARSRFSTIPRASGIGARHITISTVGVLPGIVALGERPEQFRLAISIHAPSDALRRELMPINTKYPLADVIDAAKVFDRRVTFEYVMLGGVNDAAEHAIQLAALARECRAFVNLIPLHPGGARGFTPTPRRRHSRVRARAARRGRRGGGAKEPRRGHRRGVRTATGGTARPAAATTTRCTTAISR